MAATTAEKQRAVEQQVNTDSLLKPSKSEKGVTVGKSNGGETGRVKEDGGSSHAIRDTSLSPCKHPTEGGLWARVRGSRCRMMRRYQDL